MVKDAREMATASTPATANIELSAASVHAVRQLADANILVFDNIMEFADGTVSRRHIGPRVVQDFLVIQAGCRLPRSLGVTEKQWRAEADLGIFELDGDLCETCGIKTWLRPATIGVLRIPLHRRLSLLPVHDDLIQLIATTMAYEERQCCNECCALLGAETEEL